MRKQTLLRVGLFLVVASFSFMSMGQTVSAKNADHLSGKEKAEQAKLKKATRMAKAHKRTIPGKVVSFDGVTLVMMKGNKTYTVTTDANTSFVDREWKPIDKSLVIAGHRVTVKGMVTGMNVVATSVRDIKLPVKTAATAE